MFSTQSHREMTPRPRRSVFGKRQTAAIYLSFRHLPLLSPMTHELFDSRQTFKTGDGGEGTFYSIPALEQAGLGGISRLPVCIRIVLESVLRNFDGGRKVSEESIRALAAWQPSAERTEEIPFVV